MQVRYAPNDLRNLNKKYTAQELDAIVFATIKENGFRVINSFKNTKNHNSTAYTLYTDSKRFIAVFPTTNNRDPQTTTDGKIIDKELTGKFTLDKALQFYQQSIEQYNKEFGKKDFELIIPICLCPIDPEDPKHLVYLKIHKINNKMHAVFLIPQTKYNTHLLI